MPHHWPVIAASVKIGAGSAVTTVRIIDVYMHTLFIPRAAESPLFEAARRAA
jgi:hypothetical protein